MREASARDCLMDMTLPLPGKKRLNEEEMGEARLNEEEMGEACDSEWIDVSLGN